MTHTTESTQEETNSNVNKITKQEVPNPQKHRFGNNSQTKVHLGELCDPCRKLKHYSGAQELKQPL